MSKNHYAIIDAYPHRISIKYQDKIIAQTEKALILKEVTPYTVYNPSFYIPKEEVYISLVPDEARKSACPIKGACSYWNLEENPTENYFAWSYEEPLEHSQQIKGYIDFNLQYTTFISEPI